MCGMKATALLARFVPANGWAETTSSTIRHHQHRPNTDMDPRNPFSKGFEKLKRKLSGGSRKQDGRSESKNDQDGREANAEGGEASQRNSRLHPVVEDAVESRPSREGNDVNEKEVDQVNPPTSRPSSPHSGKPDGI